MVVIAIIKPKKNGIVINFEEKSELHNKGFQILESSKKVILTGVVKIDLNYDAGDRYYIIKNKEFEVKITIDKTNKSLPEVIETSKKVDSNYHKFRKGNLCLGSSIELWQGYIASNKSITKYIDQFIIPYFFRYCCIKEYGDFPVGEYSHGDGIREAYEDILGIKEKDKIISILEFYLGNKNMLCPCGSGLKFRECHYSQIHLKLSKVSKQVLKKDMKTLKKLKSKKFYKKFI
ncbi:MAG: SEC-C metal-binding domain-containing protein [Psychrilyobacter sp.]|uniref:SEC-C metal-binding domain-containing protein n=1 Tax=Psychrilyobacter sp. TaxID=2586924 RepID=UPI003C7360C2